MKINSKKLRYGTAASAITVIVIVMVVLLNVIIAALNDRYPMSFDLTPGGNFEISRETKDYLASLNEDVEICTTSDELAFQTTGSKYYRQAYEVLKKYAQYSDRISLNFVDMTVDPTYVEKYMQYYSGGISANNIIIFNKNSHRIKVISVNDLFNTETDFYAMSQKIVSSKAEQVMTSAIMYITDPNPQTAVYLDAVTSSMNSGNIVSMLEDNGFEVIIIDPNSEPIPEEADMLIINAPLNDFSEELVSRIYDFMENDGKYGKNMIYLSSYDQHSTPNIDAFLAEWGIAVENGLVSDNNMQYIASAISPYAVMAFIEQNDYTGGIPSEVINSPVMLINCRPITLLYEYSGNVNTMSLLTTSETGFAVTEAMRLEYEETGVAPMIHEQQVPVIALASKYTFIDNAYIRSNILVMGCDDILNEGLTSQTYYNNGDYFISIVNKISGKENGITIVAKDLTSDTYETNAAQFNAIRVVFAVVIPGLVIIAGIMVWLRRRHL